MSCLFILITVCIVTNVQALPNEQNQNSEDEYSYEVSVSDPAAQDNYQDFIDDDTYPTQTGDERYISPGVIGKDYYEELGYDGDGVDPLNNDLSGIEIIGTEPSNYSNIVKLVKNGSRNGVQEMTTFQDVLVITETSVIGSNTSTQFESTFTPSTPAFITTTFEENEDDVSQSFMPTTAIENDPESTLVTVDSTTNHAVISDISQEISERFTLERTETQSTLNTILDFVPIRTPPAIVIDRNTGEFDDIENETYNNHREAYIDHYTQPEDEEYEVINDTPELAANSKNSRDFRVVNAEEYPNVPEDGIDMDDNYFNEQASNEVEYDPMTDDSTLIVSTIAINNVARRSLVAKLILLLIVLAFY
ncbi:hypothetical protein ACOME3_007410 [Neoechinorhynchus agilis]